MSYFLVISAFLYMISTVDVEFEHLIRSILKRVLLPSILVTYFTAELETNTNNLNW